MLVGDRTQIKLRFLAPGGLRTARQDILWGIHLDSEITQDETMTKDVGRCESEVVSYLGVNGRDWTIQ